MRQDLFLERFEASAWKGIIGTRMTGPIFSKDA
jgi:hypothetical protein